MTQLWGSHGGWYPDSRLRAATASPRCCVLSSHPTVHLPPPFPLKQVKVPIVENSICDTNYHVGLYTGDNIQIIRDDMMCAGSRKKDSCQVGPCPPPESPEALASRATADPSPP